MSGTANLPETELTFPQQPELNCTAPRTTTEKQPTTNHWHSTKTVLHNRHRSVPTNPYQKQNNNYHTKQDLTNWLTTACKQPSINPSKTTPITTPRRVMLPQPVIQPDQANKIWGDTVLQDHHPNIFRIMSRNVNTLSPAKDFVDWKAASQALAEYLVTMACLQETNLQWNMPITNQIKQIFHDLPTKQTKMATSNSTEVTPSNYQPGGTCIALMGPWISAAKISGKDPSGMGRWSFIEMEGKEAHRRIFVSGYWSCNQNTRLGLAMYHDQQIRILMDQGQTNPDPHHQFLEDLISQIRTWHQQHKAVFQ